jgi:hypothetical protein
LELTKKLGAGKLKQISFRPDALRDKNDGVYIYKCLSCGQKWKMRDQLYGDDLNGAFFRKKWAWF